MINKVCVLGLGYIGLPTSLLVANSGITTLGFDVDDKKVKKINNGELFFEEKGLYELFEEVKKKNTFRAISDLEHADVFIIAVPTPVKDGAADLTYIHNALSLIRPKFKEGNLIVVESTVGPLDCAEHIIPEIGRWNIKFRFAHCTERAIPGNTLYEMVHNSRVVGGLDDESKVMAKELYASFTKGELYITDPTTAAVCKVMENTYRSVNIALANEFAKLSSGLGIDVWEAIEITNKHPRVNIHQPGPGVGGHCIPIDPYFFINKDYPTGIIKISLKINEEMPFVVCQEVTTLINKFKLQKPKIGVLGYAYKKNVDDIRETPAKVIVDTLGKDFGVCVNDSNVVNDDFLDLHTLLSVSDVVVLVTDHDEYAEIDFSKYPNITFVYDTRNLFVPEKFENIETYLYRLGA
jgi:UDP-N-acetyl-D-mannosaminuronic acid dehydrogenase